MRNTKENRIAWCRNMSDTIYRHKRVPLKATMKAAHALNNALSKKRKVVLIKERGELRSEFYSNLSSELRNELRNELYSNLFSEFRNELRNKLRSELYSNLFSEFYSNLSSELRSELRSDFDIFNLWESYESVMIQLVRYFYPNLDSIKKNKKKIDALAELSKCGYINIMINKTTLFVVTTPIVELLDGQLHSDTTYALRWLGKKSYWLYGRKLEQALWKKITTKNITTKEVFGIENMEQRMVAIKYLGTEWLLDSVDAKLLDKSKMGNELYIVESVFPMTAYFLKYSCPSMDRVYVKGVAPNFTSLGYKLTADDAQAWSFQLTTTEYLAINKQT